MTGSGSPWSTCASTSASPTRITAGSTAWSGSSPGRSCAAWLIQTWSSKMASAAGRPTGSNRPQNGRKRRGRQPMKTGSSSTFVNAGQSRAGSARVFLVWEGSAPITYSRSSCRQESCVPQGTDVGVSTLAYKGLNLYQESYQEFFLIGFLIEISG